MHEDEATRKNYQKDTPWENVRKSVLLEETTRWSNQKETPRERLENSIENSTFGTNRQRMDHSDVAEKAPLIKYVVDTSLRGVSNQVCRGQLLERTSTDGCTTAV